MLSLTTVFAMSAISVFTGAGAALIFQAIFGEANTPTKRACLVVMGLCASLSTALFLLVHIK